MDNAQLREVAFQAAGLGASAVMSKPGAGEITMPEDEITEGIEKLLAGLSDDAHERAAITNRKIRVYEDEAGETRWQRRVIPSEKITADSGEGYTNRQEGIDAAHRENPGVAVVLDFD